MGVGRSRSFPDLVKGEEAGGDDLGGFFEVLFLKGGEGDCLHSGINVMIASFLCSMTNPNKATRSPIKNIFYKANKDIELDCSPSLK